MKQTTGSFDLADRGVFFLANAVWEQLETAIVRAGARYVLAAVPDINDQGLAMIDRTARKYQVRWLIDSGIFGLTNEHKRIHGITMDEALALAPDEIDGFDALMARYMRIADRLGDVAWGMIELDQGGMDNKIKTRERIEQTGLIPIPVWHPLNDGAAYFDELAASYDRICMGNLVQADRRTRTRLLATLWERHAAYPNLWVHCLGMTPNDLTAAYPFDSCDSSTWTNAIRWSGPSADYQGGSMPLHREFQAYRRVDAPEDAPDGEHYDLYHRSLVVTGMEKVLSSRSRRGLADGLEAKGIGRYEPCG